MFSDQELTVVTCSVMTKQEALVRLQQKHSIWNVYIPPHYITLSSQELNEIDSKFW